MPAQVLVLGGGFAGLAAVSELARRRHRGADVAIRLIDARPHAAFSPLFPDLVSGRVLTEHVCHALGPHCQNLGVDFARATVQAIFPDRGVVETNQGSFSADYLIICLGCETNYFGEEQMKARALGLKSVGEGLAIRARVRELVRLAPMSERSRPRVHVVVVGGGYTGFEIASHVACLLRSVSGRSYGRLRSSFRILIVEKNEVLRTCSVNVRRWATRLAQSSGIAVRTGLTAQAFDGEGNVRMSDGSVLANAMVVWAAGVTPVAACTSLDVPKTQGGRLAVDGYLRLPDAPRAFAAGDVAGARGPGQDAPLRMAVQFSLAGGACAAANVVRSIEGKPLAAFAPRDLGYVVPLGPGQAAGVVLGREVHGRLPWMLHYSMCALRSWSWRNGFGIVSDLFRRWPQGD